MHFLLIFFLILISPCYAEARLKIVTTYPYIADIVRYIVTEKAEVRALSNGDIDPHFVVAKPSLIAIVRQADLLIANGADLEVGWLPQVIKQANNSRLHGLGYIDLSMYVTLIDIPKDIGRHMGDVHPHGNPHFHLDPYNIPIIAEAITDRVCEIDFNNCMHYKGQLKAFKNRWSEALSKWDKKASGLKGKGVIQYHSLFNYLLNRYQIASIGTIEPLPGIPPTARHLDKLIKDIEAKRPMLILQDVYHPQKSAQYLSEKTGVPFAVVPHDVGATPAATDIFTLFEVIFNTLTR